MTPRAVVLDYGAVLCHEQPAGDLAAMERLAAVAGSRLWAEYWGHREPYDRGELNGAGYWRQIAADLGIHLDDERIAELVAADVASWSHLRTQMLDWAVALRGAGVRVALLSNAPPELRDAIERMDWARELDHRTFSCDLGVVKPEPTIYRECLEALRVDAADALLVDDREVNLDGGRRVGLPGVRFTTAPALAAALADSGLPLPA
jgi:putative hydrolase of the HAD superfamily